ncbi:MAG: malate dehydrogenase [Chloroflexi bacterium]|nr:malate dehydrogenase [Chloroflexota bacterium]
MRKKISIIGAGQVGATTGLLLAQQDVYDIAFVEIVEGLGAGKGLDMLEAGPILDYDSHIEGTTDPAALEGSDLVIITSGMPRKPGMSRTDLLQANADIVRQNAANVAKYAPKSIAIMLNNPLDPMTQLFHKTTGFPKERVIGQAGVLDSARFRTFIALELDVSVEDVTAFVLGGHGDEMVPLPRYSTVAGIPITELLPQERIDAIVRRTAGGGGEIVNLLKTGSAFYAPAAALAEMASSILLDKKRVLPCSAYLEGEYGISGIFFGVPCKLGARGIEQIIEISLTVTEQEALNRSASAVRTMVTELRVA